MFYGRNKKTQYIIIFTNEMILAKNQIIQVISINEVVLSWNTCQTQFQDIFLYSLKYEIGWNVHTKLKYLVSDCITFNTISFIFSLF